MPGPNEVNEVATRAYELSVRADRLLDQGDLAQAKTLMTEAAMIDGTYAVRAELLGVPDTRRVRVNPALKKLVLPFLTDAGFLPNPLGLSHGDGIFERSRGSNTHFLFISRTKFAKPSEHSPAATQIRVTSFTSTGGERTFRVVPWRTIPRERSRRSASV